ERLLAHTDWKPTYINSLTASTPGAIKTPIHFPTDREALSAIAPTVGRNNLAEVTYCRIRNTLELVDLGVSENLVPRLASNVAVISDPFDARFDARGDLEAFESASQIEHAPSLSHA
ncbi:MAG: hypothetical protein JO210_12750, partial [Acidobacteriaceae bacterium]|nr:hypothetical protein [Acidobacteriaceae bacterium]